MLLFSPSHHPQVKPGGDKSKTKEPQNQYEITLKHTLSHHDTKALMKSCESLAFLVRDAAHVTPANFESCVHAIRTFVEATVNGGRDHQAIWHLAILF